MNKTYKQSQPKYLRRWWLRFRPCKTQILASEYTGYALEFYVPWWAWPFELIHRMIFGRAKLTPIKSTPNGSLQELKAENVCDRQLLPNDLIIPKAMPLSLEKSNKNNNNQRRRLGGFI
jgi:hypothetical protein